MHQVVLFRRQIPDQAVRRINLAEPAAVVNTLLVTIGKFQGSMP